MTMEPAGSASSLEMVAVPWPSVRTAPLVGLARLRTKVSSGSKSVSPLMVTAIVRWSDAVGEGEGAAGGEVVAAGGGGAVSGGVIDAEGGGAAAAGDGEGGEFGAGIALEEGDVVDDDGASGLGVIVGDGGRCPGHR